METYDVLVLGGGSAGTAAANAAHRAGKKTAMFNKGELGGLCILMGCMPTTTMLHAAHLLHEAHHHDTPGIGRTAPSVDFAAVMANKDAKVARFKRAKVAGIEAGGYEVIDARARFSGPDTVEAGNETYDLYADDSGSFHLFERYTDSAALDVHRASDHYRNYRAGVADVLDGTVGVMVLSEHDVAS